MLDGVTPLALIEQALASRCGVWGGSAHAVFPLSVDPDELLGCELFWRLADVFDVDTFAVHAFTGEDLVELAPTRAAEHLSALERQWPHDPQRQIVRDYFLRDPLNDPRLSPALHDALIERLAPLHWDEDLMTATTAPSWGTADPPTMSVAELADLPQRMHAPITPLSSPYPLLLTAEAGRWTAADRQALVARDVDVVDVTLDSSRCLTDRLVAPGEAAQPEPWTVSELGCDWYLTRRRVREPTTLVVGDDPWDFALFYALRRLTGRAYWLPTSLLGDSVYLSRLAKALHVPARRMSMPIRAVSYSDATLAQAGHGELAKACPPQLPVEFVDWRAAIPTSPNRLYATDQPGRFETVLLHEGETPPLATPAPHTIRHVEAYRTQWFVDADVEGWRPLRHPALSKQLLDNPGAASFLQRCGRAGMSFLGPTQLVQPGVTLESLASRPRLRVRELFDQLSLAAAHRQWRVEQSDKGAFARRAASIFGGFRGLASALREPHIAAVLAAFLAGAKHEGPGWWLSADSRRYLTLKDLAAVLGGDADDLLDNLRGRGAVALGSILKCARCRQAAWYDVEAFGRTFTCSRCRYSQKGNRFSWLGAPEPQWTYRLDEALRQFLAHDGDLPVLAAYDLLGETELPLDVAYELDVYSPDDEKSELDIAVADGSTLWIGEATVSERLEASGQAETERLQRLVEVARVFSARHVALVNAGAWAEPTLRRARANLSGPWPELHVVEHVARPRPAGAGS